MLLTPVPAAGIVEVKNARMKFAHESTSMLVKDDNNIYANVRISSFEY